jgi:hypothetical protein
MLRRESLHQKNKGRSFCTVLLTMLAGLSVGRARDWSVNCAMAGRLQIASDDPAGYILLVDGEAICAQAAVVFVRHRHLRRTRLVTYAPRAAVDTANRLYECEMWLWLTRRFLPTGGANVCRWREMMANGTQEHGYTAISPVSLCGGQISRHEQHPICDNLHKQRLKCRVNDDDLDASALHAPFLLHRRPVLTIVSIVMSTPETSAKAHPYSAGHIRTCLPTL